MILKKHFSSISTLKNDILDLMTPENYKKQFLTIYAIIYFSEFTD